MTGHGVSTVRVKPSGPLPDLKAGEFGVAITLSRDPTPLSEMSRIARWIVDAGFGATFHWAPDGTVWDDVVDETALFPPGWNGRDLPESIALTSWVSPDESGLEDIASMLPSLVRDEGPALILDIGPAPHGREVARLQALIAAYGP